MPRTPPALTAQAAARWLVATGRACHARGWVMGTSGNLSVVRQTRPLVVAITASGAHKGALTSRDILEIDTRGRLRRGTARPSAETALHLEIIRARNAGAVLHTHSVWSTILSKRHLAAGGLALGGYEMLKGLEGVATHAHREWLPIVANSQDMPALAAELRGVLQGHPTAHGVLIAAHGLYTWGRTRGVAARHLEILEFLLEVEGRSQSWPS